MRSFLMLTGIAVCLYLHFSKKEEKVATIVKEDTLSNHLSAMDKKGMASAHGIVEEEAPAESFAGAIPGEREDSHDREEDAEVSSDDEMAQLPWEEIEEGWRTQLRDYLISVVPDQAEEIFASYLEEKRKFMDRVEVQENGNGVAEEGPEADDQTERSPAHKNVDIEAVHEENLREIFGEHFNQIRSLHEEYVESVQYLNRSSVRFTISL